MRYLAGILFGVALFLVGGITWQPPVPKCPGCAVLTHAYPGCDEVVQGGYICQ